MDLKDRYRGCLLGLACGDAVGTTVEFKPRGSFVLLEDMVGGGPFNLPVGAWTDDTSMALCLAASLLECKTFNAHDQMERYVRWYRQGYMSSTGRCFDIGITTSSSLRHFSTTNEAFAGSDDPYSAGNGSIMRLAPVPMFFFSDLTQAREMSAESSRTTHGTQECLDACRLLAQILCRAFEGKSKEECLFRHDMPHCQSEKINAVAAGEFRDKAESEISGSGYVVDSLEAALWCVWQTENFRDAILRAVNLGDDADTTGAVCGQIAGAIYGETGIPVGWQQKLVQYELIRDMADGLYQAAAMR